MDLVAAVLSTADASPDALAIGEMTYGELARRVRCTAAGLLDAGLEPGDRVLFSVRPEAAGVVLALGIVAAGGTVVFADPGTGPELFAARLALAGPTWAAAESLLYATSRYGRGLARRRGLLLPSYRELPVRHVYAGRWLPGVPGGALSARRLASTPSITAGGAARGGSGVAGHAGSGVAGRSGVAHLADQEALVVFTSGSTAAPKAVVHTRGSLGAGLQLLATRCRIGPGDTVHTDQLMLGLPALVAGAHWTMPPYGFAPGADPARYAAGLRGATHAFCVPADLAVLLDAGITAPGLRHLLVGGAPVLPPLLRRARAALGGTEILAVYGMTEILPIAIATAEEKLAHTGPGDLIGEPLPGVLVTIAPDGELSVSGPNLCRGYLGEAPLDSHATGDLAAIDDGRLVLLGRKKDMIIRRKTNVYPGLYEPAISTLPGVREAALVGVPDEIGDERIVLAVVPDLVREPGHDGRPGRTGGPGDGHELVAELRARLPHVIDASALPDEIVPVAAIPTVGRTRKPDREALRRLVTGDRAEAGKP
ncbi:fatty-acyl-CoA synthase [Longispora fulva]|uniref:Acyl-CoA synthetase (AMP-forming)/AMP-acid ligase II n=1 Tax=Longispora fulva TaxID=619741 RepID=A0A8J7KMK8_9ACTN|nr:class I adenylate-forming enzyme family protein [Longispora fulva]MBG6139266.1 acyl-CoA synthetase (AMP-forming)/AMP-acid ligase II [Longispora fulva]GIG58760.1 fatty-acyl-CoA synthase [Longispora fulva]